MRFQHCSHRPVAGKINLTQAPKNRRLVDRQTVVASIRQINRGYFQWPEKPPPETHVRPKLGCLSKKSRRQPMVNRKPQNAMALYCRMIGATIDIVSEAVQGTRLTIDLPCPLPRHHAKKN
jgi:hypothetical protein